MNGTTAASTVAEGIPPDLAQRFGAAAKRLLPEGGRIGLAVSGGPDSMAMLLLAHAAMPDRIEVATINHGLRAEAADECALVEQLCIELGIACEVLAVEVGEGNLQEQARLARYAALAAWAGKCGLAAIATAHHADDQAETLLMRLNRGSGVAGLAGIRARGVVPGGDLPLLRPLLDFRRIELEQVVQATGAAFASDPSNLDERFERVRVRRALAGSALIDPLALASSGEHLADAADALQWAAQREWDECVSATPEEARYRSRGLKGAPKAVVMIVLERILAQFGGAPRGGAVARLYDHLTVGEGGNVAGVLAVPEGHEWVFRREPPRRSGRA